MRRFSRRGLPTLLAFALAACSMPAARKEPPRLADLAKQAEPAADKLVIAAPAPATANPQIALDNYRKLLQADADPKLRAEALRRIADLQLQIADERGDETADNNNKAISDSIQIYETLLKEHPDDPKNDSALLQLARAYENSGDVDDAVRTLMRLEQEYPKSSLAPDVHFQAAQLLFGQKHYTAAEKEYAAALAYGPAMPFYDAAQYKYGWSLFKQSEYDEAIAQFLALLDRVLPANVSDDPDKALKQVPKNRADVAGDSLRALSLCFSELGGPNAIANYFAQRREPRYAPLLYTSLGASFLEKHRFSDAAQTYAAFVARQPADPHAPAFQARIITAYEDGGFTESVVTEKERYAKTYAPGAPYWNGRPPTPDVLKELRRQLEDVAKYHHALAQHDPKEHRDEFLVAAGWYRNILRIYPRDPQAAAINQALADALLDGGQTRNAADEYMRTAYDYPRSSLSPDAAYAAVQTYERYAQEVTPDKRNEALMLAAAAGVRLADAFPDHPQKLKVITRAAEDLYTIGDREHAVGAAAIVEDAQPPASPDLLRSAWAVTADSQFALGRYKESEAAYAQLQKLIPASDPAYKTATDQLAASIYKQAAATRASGDFAAAARGFEKVGENAPTAGIRATADYDAAAAYIQAKDWANAERLLENYTARYPDTTLGEDIDKKLAVVYQNDSKPYAAARIYQRIAARETETTQTRHDSAWLAAQLYDQSHHDSDAMQAYQTYLAAYPQPIDQTLTARQRLADLAHAQHDDAAYERWLRAVVNTDEEAGSQRSNRTRALAARALLEIGRMQARTADAIPLTLPITKSVPAKKAATEIAIATLNRAADYGFTDVATAATYELGTLYQHFSQALLKSERPRNLKGEEADQYELLLEEQAEPFDEKAIKTFEINIQRIRSNVYDEWVSKSLAALAVLAPAKYGKQELKDTSYDRLH
jgi:TolA-binding protein